MQELAVYADFDFLSAPEQIGTVRREMLRGAAKYSFEFTPQWLESHPSLYLSADLENYAGRQFSRSDTEIFGFISDALPDRWGRLLFRRREEIVAVRENRPPRNLTPFDYLSGLDDGTRVGALRFKIPGTECFLHPEDKLAIPPLASVRELMAASSRIEESERKHQTPEEKWINQLLFPGSSLGGARPKATVIDENGHLWVAKFPSVNDNHDVGLWEFFAYRLAEKAGIHIAPTKILSTDSGHHIFLVRRFDRIENTGRRIHFASAMTLLGLSDGAGASSNNGYTDLADFIIEHSVNTEENLTELYRRIAFNIAVGNADDHFRNHGFLLSAQGWQLSPAYDMNPTTELRQSLLINHETDTADLNQLLHSCELYFLDSHKALSIIEEVVSAASEWPQEAKKLNIPLRDQRIFATRFFVKFAPTS